MKQAAAGVHTNLLCMLCRCSSSHRLLLLLRVGHYDHAVVSGTAAASKHQLQ
jgi:hypothetical protein